MSSHGPMLRKTYELLQVKLEETNKRLSSMSDTLRETYESGGQWHDNPQWEYTMADQRKLQQEQAAIFAAVSGAVFIENLKLAEDVVTIGKTVTFKNLKTEKTLTINVVGSADVQHNPECSGLSFASFHSPIATALRGKKEGEKVTFRDQTLHIIKIKPLEGVVVS